jgi:integrase
MPKRANNEGSIRKRPDGRWEARYTLGRDPGTGKQVQKSVYGDTQKEVRQRLQQIATAIDEGTYLEPSKMTVAKWLNIWLADYLGNVKPGTVANYSQHVNNHIAPAIGAIKLTALQPTAIQRLYNDLQEKGLSAKTIKNLHGVLHRALQTAVKLGYTRTNPTSACILPRVEKKDIQPLDTPELARFMSALKGHPHETLFKVALFSGARSGELLGLTWDCVKFDSGTIYICKQLSAPRKKGEAYKFASLKNDKPRTITPAPYVMRLLKEHKLAQLEQRILVGSAWDTEGFDNLVFTNELGGHLTQSGTWKMLQKVFDNAGIEHRPFHQLRHSYAVNSIRSGDDIKTIQENLGHHTAAFTLDMYGHVTESMKRESAERMEAFIKGIPDA